MEAGYIEERKALRTRHRRLLSILNIKKILEFNGIQQKLDGCALETISDHEHFFLSRKEAQGQDGSEKEEEKKQTLKIIQYGNASNLVYLKTKMPVQIARTARAIEAQRWQTYNKMPGAQPGFNRIGLVRTCKSMIG